MAEEATKLLAAVMKLPVEARAAIAGSLIESLDTTVDSDAEAEWAVEIARRLEAFDRGEISAIPWAEARRRIVAE